VRPCLRRPGSDWRDVFPWGICIVNLVANSRSARQQITSSRSPIEGSAVCDGDGHWLCRGNLFPFSQLRSADLPVFRPGGCLYCDGCTKTAKLVSSIANILSENGRRRRGRPCVPGFLYPNCWKAGNVTL